MTRPHRFVSLVVLNSFAVGLLALTVSSASSQSGSTLPRRAILPHVAADSAIGLGPGCIIPPAGMVAWWPMDDGVGATEVVDITGGNNATPQTGGLVGLPNGPDPVPGKVGGALRFVGVPGQQYAEVPAPAAGLNFAGGSFSIDAWVNTAMGTQTEPIVDKIGPLLGANSGYSLSIQGSSPYYLTLGIGTGSAIQFVQGPPILAGAWNFVAVMVSPPSVQFYVANANGSNQSTGSIGTTSASTTLPLLIGKNPANPHVDITIDELEIFNRALALPEMQGIFNAGSAGKCKSTGDLGDAPDRNNSSSLLMTAYTPPVPANFPTVFNSSSPGPKHFQPKAVAWLGPDVSLEVDADVGLDQDPTTNIVPSLNQADKDLKDDGLVSLPALPTTFCSQITFTYSVSFAAATTQPLYFNAWFDFNQDGDWQDGGKCAVGPSTTGLLSEWAVQDQVIPPGSGPASLTVTTPLFMAQRADPTNDVWMRITLSDQPAVDPDGSGPLKPDGRGPAAGFKYGETEDYLLRTSSQASEVCGVKFNDLNGNGVQDPGEPGLPGWTITVAPGSLTTTTNANGSYCFGPLAPGTYTVSEVQQVGWTVTTPPGGTITITVPPSVTNINFGNRRLEGQLSEVCGIKFNDLNGNGVKDPGEPGLPGWTITIAPGSLTTTTNANGSYCFVSLAPGTYTVSEILQTGWTQTLPGGPGTYTVTVPPSVTNLNFGNCRATLGTTCVAAQLSEVCGLKFNDMNANGVKDPGESGLSGWTITLSPGSLTATTDANGNYCFGSLAPGTYTVSEVVQAGWTQTLPGGPGTYTVTVPPSVTNLIFGNCRPNAVSTCSAQQLSEVCGLKFNDLNHNGVKDPGEPGLAGWTITLSPGSLTTTTGANGNYCFGSLSPGTYTISEVLQPGWTQTLPGGSGSYTVTVPPSVTNRDFGNCQPQLGAACTLAAQ